MTKYRISKSRHNTRYQLTSYFFYRQELQFVKPERGKESRTFRYFNVFAELRDGFAKLCILPADFFMSREVSPATRAHGLIRSKKQIGLKTKTTHRGVDAEAKESGQKTDMKESMDVRPVSKAGKKTVVKLVRKVPT